MALGRGITGLLDSDDGRSLFVEGCVSNQSKFYNRPSKLSSSWLATLERLAAEAAGGGPMRLSVRKRKPRPGSGPSDLAASLSELWPEPSRGPDRESHARNFSAIAGA